jgi:serine/threonine-protein kinase
VKTVPRFLVLLLLALALASSGSAPAAGNTYAAVAFSPSTGAYGYGNGFRSKEEAIERAEIECGEPDAIVKWCRNSWIALAVSSDGGYGWSWASTAGRARARAVANCLQQNDDAKVVICVRSNG